MRRAMILALTILLAGGVSVSASTLNYLGSYTLSPSSAKDISGLTYDAVRNVYYAVSDREGGFYTLTIDVDQNGIHNVRSSGMTLLDSDQGTAGIQPYQSALIDAEAIALLPQDRLVIASERGASNGPWIRTFSLEGALIGEIPVPRKFLPATSLGRGLRPNLAFEAMALHSTGNTLYVANEQALEQDGDEATVTRGTPVRIAQYNLSGNPPTDIAEYVYVTEKIFVVPRGDGGSFNGVSSMVAVKHLMPQYDLIVMERSYASGVGYDIKLFGVSFSGATNIVHAETLPCLCSTKAVRKTLLVRISSHEPWSEIAVFPDNMEAMTIGPQLMNGHYTLILAGDNEGDPAQPTLFLVFEIVP